MFRAAGRKVHPPKMTGTGDRVCDNGTESAAVRSLPADDPALDAEATVVPGQVGPRQNALGLPIGQDRTGTRGAVAGGSKEHDVSFQCLVNRLSEPGVRNGQGHTRNKETPISILRL